MIASVKTGQTRRIDVIERDVDADGRCVIGRVEELAGGDRWLVKAGHRTVGVFRIDGNFYALLNRCPHTGAELCRGDIVMALDSSGPGDYSYKSDKPVIVCPWHAWEFDLATGRSHFDPTGVRVKSYPVGVERELTAETYPVDVDDGNVVIYLRGRPRR
jgi:nitrite reductase/ring-hydroxylating ferredoxin subunit